MNSAPNATNASGSHFVPLLVEKLNEPVCPACVVESLAEAEMSYPDAILFLPFHRFYFFRSHTNASKPTTARPTIKGQFTGRVSSFVPKTIPPLLELELA